MPMEQFWSRSWSEGIKHWAVEVFLIIHFVRQSFRDQMG